MKQTLPVAIGIAIVLIAATYTFVRNRTTNADYNPNYVAAIRQKDPSRCSDIAYALESQPNDAIIRVTGDRAISICKQQAQQGFIGCECNAEATLDAMLNRSR